MDLYQTLHRGEDFAFYCEQIPGVFFRLGSGNDEERTRYPLHHPMFDLDETAMPYGVGMLSAVALEFWHGIQLLRGAITMKKDNGQDCGSRYWQS